MNKRYSYSILASASLSVLAMVSGEAQAQDDASTIIVTARRTEERLQDVPISITVFNQQQLTNRNVIGAQSLAAYTPSLSANSRFGNDSSTFAIRGFVQANFTVPSVAVYFADVVAPRAQGGTSAGNGAGVGSFFDLANVSVLKGPQGTLFGRNTTGGAVSLTPQKPTGSFEGYVEGSVGNYDMRRIQAVINVPIGDSFRARLSVDRQTRDGFLNNISGVGPRDFADIDYTAVRFSAVADLTPNLENYTIISYNISNTNGSIAKPFHIVSEIDRSVTVPGVGVISLPSTTRPFRLAQLAATAGNYYDVMNSLPIAKQRNQTWQIINTTTWKATDNLTIKNIASYAEFRQAQNSNIYGESNINFAGPGANFYAQNVYAAPGSNNAQQSTFTEELQLQGSANDTRFIYQVGAYLELSEPLSGFQTTYSINNLACTDLYNFVCRNNPAFGLNPTATAGNAAISASKYKFRNLGLYGQATYKFTEQLSLTAGLRYTSDITSGLGQARQLSFPTPFGAPVYRCTQPTGIVQGGTSAQVQNDPTLCNLARRVASDKPTWLIGVDYKPTEDILAYAKYARGYRQGNINVSSFGLETWGPEKVDAYEIGLKTSFRGAINGTFNIAGFYNDLANQQISINVVNCDTAAQIGALPAQCVGFTSSAGFAQPNNSQGIGNGGKSRIKGVEVDASISPFTGFRIDGSYAYIDAKLLSATIAALPNGFAPGFLAGILGGQLPLTPKNKYTVTGSYTLPLDESVGKITLAATFIHQDSTFGDTSSAGSAPDRVRAFPDNVDGDRRLPPQNLLNLNFNWNSVAGTPVDLALFATNVTKAKFSLYNTGSSFGTDAAVLNEPRMYGLRLKYRFGS